jgi:hypothetical protein
MGDDVVPSWERARWPIRGKGEGEHEFSHKRKMIGSNPRES